LYCADQPIDLISSPEAAAAPAAAAATGVSSKHQLQQQQLQAKRCSVAHRQ
jgi:hypothetical protein